MGESGGGGGGSGMGWGPSSVYLESISVLGKGKQMASQLTDLFTSRLVRETVS